MGVAFDDEQLDQVAGDGLLFDIVWYVIKKSREILSREREKESGFGGAKFSW